MPKSGWVRRNAVWVAAMGLSSLLSGSTASDLARAATSIELDTEACYRIRDLDIVREDLRLFLADGYLIFAKPVAGVRTAAVFLADVEGGDAEVLLLPPTKTERQSLASFIDSPNLNEHFKAAVMVFSDDTHAELSKIIAERGMKQVPEIGVMIAEHWQLPARNISRSFESRITLDLLSAQRARGGFFFAAISGVTRGNFDVIYDPRSPEQIVVGQITFRNERPQFETWTSFEGRRWRRGQGETGLDVNEFELSDYRITADVAPPLMTVTTRVKLRPAAAGAGALPFDISRSMKVTAVSIDGKPAEVLAPDSFRANLIRNSSNDLFLVVPPEPLDPARTYEIEIKHQGDVIQTAAEGVFAIRARSNWYPSRGAQFATYDLTFRHPAGLTLVSTGELAGESVDGDIKITHRRTSVPVRLAGFNLGDYRVVKVERGGTRVEVYSNRALDRAMQARPREAHPPQAPPMFPGRGRRIPDASLPDPLPPPVDPNARLSEMAEQVAGALDFMAARFGPAPLRQLAVSPVPGTFGQGFPGLIYLSQLSYLPVGSATVSRLTPEYRTFFSEILHAHETAHQWWGSLVTSAGYPDDWLLESLANYSALMYFEKRKGSKALDAMLAGYRENLLDRHDDRTIESAGAIAMGTRLLNSTIPGAWRTITYEKGSWVMHMLRRRMGDERFSAMLGELRRRFERKSISTGEFRRLAAEFLPPKSSDPQLEAFFEQWVYSTGVPTLSMQYTVRGKAPKVEVKGTVMQTGVPDDFSAVVEIEAQMRGKSVRRDVRTSTGEAVNFTMTLPAAPSKMVLDPSGGILATVKR